MPNQTPSQTVGPFFGPALIADGLEMPARDGARGRRIIISGRVLDGDGEPVPDAMIEIWQANADGRYDHPADTQEKRIDPCFHGFGRAGTAADGAFRFVTIKPGAAIGDGAIEHAPHINVSVFARGLLNRLVTRIYFPDQPLNDSDPVLARVPAVRRATLIAQAIAESRGVEYRFDIILQGAGETVFFDI
jgi:protocatechuate 3,4-dioxygenase alpha subunit